MKRLLSVLTLGLMVAACSQGPPPEPPPPPAANPVGEYSIAIDAMGASLGGSMTIAGTKDAWSGTLATEMGDAPMTAIAVDGMEMTFTVDIPEAFLEFVVAFEGDGFSGEFSGDIGSGTITGTRR